jgi:hypothetical protein
MKQSPKVSTVRHDAAEDLADDAHGRYRRDLALTHQPAIAGHLGE